MALRNKETVPTKSAMDSTIEHLEPTEDLPAGAVFATTELLENILRYLPMKDLLLDQRVCKKWQAVISRSKELQQQLFFQPREAQYKWLPGRGIFQRVPIDADESEDVYSLLSGELNPLLFTAGKISRQRYYKNTPIVFGGPEEQDPDSPPEGQGSWQRMLVSQPPARSLGYRWQCAARCSCEEPTGPLDDFVSDKSTLNRAMTAGDVARILDGLRAAHDAGFKLLSWEVQGIFFPRDEDFWAE